MMILEGVLTGVLAEFVSITIFMFCSCPGLSAEEMLSRCWLTLLTGSILRRLLGDCGIKY
jgi:hypothetical protein